MIVSLVVAQMLALNSCQILGDLAREFIKALNLFPHDLIGSFSELRLPFPVLVEDKKIFLRLLPAEIALLFELFYPRFERLDPFIRTHHSKLSPPELKI